MTTLLRLALLFCIIGISAQNLHAADRSAAKAYMAGVQSLFTAGDFAKAEEMCKRAIAEDATFPEAHFQLGACLEKLNKPREAFKAYQAAEALAKKEADTATQRKAATAADKIGTGLMQISKADKALADKLQKIADEAESDGQLDSARQAYAALAVLLPSDEKVKAALAKIEKAIEERGDPVKAKIAEAQLSEVWFKLGIGQKDEATKIATDLSKAHGDTEAGREAVALLERNFAAPSRDEIKKLSEKLKEKKPAVKKPSVSAPPPSVSTTTVKTTEPIKSAAPATGVDVAAIEAAARDEVKKAGKDILVANFKETFKKGETFYKGATPGSDGNQKAVASALEQFIKCEEYYMRLDEEKMLTADIEGVEKQASMLRYACMKMTILNH